MKNKTFAVLLVFLIIFTSSCNYLIPAPQATEKKITQKNDLIESTVELIPTPTETIEPILKSNCQDLNEEENQVAISIAEMYDSSYDQIMEWFCAGNSFENILVALETSTAVEITPDELLEMASENNWDLVWKSIGFIK